MQRILKYLEGDKVMWILTLFLSIVSIITVFSFIPVLVNTEGGSPIKYMFKHIFYLILGLFAMYQIHRIDPKYFIKLSKFGFYLAIALLIFTFFFGVRVNDAGRWLKIPFLPFTFQTSDFAKVALVLYLSNILAVKKSKIKDFKEGFWPAMGPVLLTVVLILRDNFSTAAMLFVICTAIMFLAGALMKHILAVVGVLVVLFSLLITVELTTNVGIFPRAHTWYNRVFSNDESENLAKTNPQVENAKKAIASAPLLGKGPGNGELKYYIAEGYADFYFALFIEEFGPILGMLIIMVYLILFFRMIRIALKTEKLTESYLVIGLGMIFMFQAIVNMGVCTGIFPVTGQNMPLLGMGGSSMVMTCVSLGIIQSISRKYNPVEEESETNNIKTNDNELEVA
ncbi:MAG: FtsW/RodA/SpoVE family cell cycle protein [Crocinitomicaceae bacterium]